MASTDRRADPSLIEQLYREPYRFEFFQAVRLLQRLVNDAGAPSAQVDGVKFTIRQYLGFTASAIQDLQPGESPKESAGGRRRRAEPPAMTVNFFGLTGPKGVLPSLYTTYVRDRGSLGDRATGEFLDIFNHRLISLFYRAWEKYRVVLGVEATESRAFTRALFALIGLGTPGLQNRQALEDSVPLAQAAHFARQRRTAEGLEDLIRDAFGLPVAVVQFVGRWVAVDESQQMRLGSAVGAELGAGFVLGSRIYDEQSKFRLRIGPLSAERFRGLLPSRRPFRHLAELTRLYVGPEFDFDIQLFLEPGAVAAPVARAEPSPSAQLGRFSWFPSPDPNFEHGAIFESPC